jgi:hypothetical protein
MDNGVTKEHATYNGEGIKQADVNFVILSIKTDHRSGQVKKDLEYYSSRIPNEGTPAMTQGSFHYYIHG